MNLLVQVFQSCQILFVELRYNLHYNVKTDLLTVITLSHTSVYRALFPLNLITELVNPPRNTFGLAELQLLFYFGQ